MRKSQIPTNARSGDGQRTRFPALRCHMGDWVFYSTVFRFEDVTRWIVPTTQINPNPALSDRIQRRLNDSSARAIANYLATDNHRFFNSIVAGVYGGDPSFGYITIDRPDDSEWSPLSEQERERFASSVGVLEFSGQETLFAVDGQHRVAGIKRAVAENPDLLDESISVILVGHKPTHDGVVRTRRLFTILNKTARKVSKSDIVLLDEDNSFAVAVRCLLNEFPAFSKGRLVQFGEGTSIPPRDSEHLTTVVALYEIALDLYGARGPQNDSFKKASLVHTRAQDDIIQHLSSLTMSFWSALEESFEDIGQVMRGELSAGWLREPGRDHFLARPIGQRALAGAASVLLGRGLSMREAVESLSNVPTSLEDEFWSHILKDPVQSKMLTTAKHRSLAEALLLEHAGHRPRSQASLAALVQIRSNQKRRT